jgi:hypothetical protein
VADITHRLEEHDGNTLLILTDGVHTRTAQFDVTGPSAEEINEQMVIAIEQFAGMPGHSALQDRPQLHGQRTLNVDQDP